MKVWLLAVLLLGGGPDPDAAERAFRAGRFDAAAEIYARVLAERGPSPALLHNLGNCAFRRDRLAEAAWYYRRALHLAPGDDAARHNLEITERRLGLVPLPRPAILRALDALGPGGMLWCCLLLQSVGLAGLLLLRGRGRRRLAMGLLAVGVGVGLAVTWNVCTAKRLEAVVVSSDAAVHRAPHTATATVARLAGGTVVSIVEASDRWARVNHAGGDGWVVRSALGAIE